MRLFWLSGLGVTVACGLFPALDDLQGAADAGGDATGTAEAGPEASVADSSVADAGSFCARQATTPFFCTDFDEDPVGFGWSGVDLTHGTAALDQALAVSPPRSGRVARTADGCGGSEFVENVPGPMKSFHLEFKVRPTSADGGIQTYLGGLFVSGADGGGGCAIILDEFSSMQLGIAIQPNAGVNDYKNSSRYPLVNQWTAIAMDVAPAVNGVTYSVTVAGQAGLPATVANGCAFGGDMRVALGPNCTVNGTELRFDDVLIDKK